jgi:hypothetical protein
MVRTIRPRWPGYIWPSARCTWRSRQTQPGFEHERNEHRGDAHPPDFASERTHVAGLIVDAIEIESAEQFGNARLREHGGAVFGFAAIHGQDAFVGGVDAGMRRVLG